MTGDIRKQLIEALDEAEQVARAAVDPWNEGSTGVWKAQPDAVLNDLIVDEGSGEIVTYDEGRPTSEQSSHMARWDPSTVLRLIERDRQLLERHKPADGWTLAGGGACEGCHADFQENYWGTVDECPELLGAAAFWLGEAAI